MIWSSRGINPYSGQLRDHVPLPACARERLRLDERGVLSREFPRIVA